MKRNTISNIKRIRQNNCGFDTNQNKKSYSNSVYMDKTIMLRAVESFEII